MIGSYLQWRQAAALILGSELISQSGSMNASLSIEPLTCVLVFFKMTDLHWNSRRVLSKCWLSVFSQC